METVFEIEKNVLIRYRGTEAVVRVPENVRRIRAYAFAKCTHVTEVDIPDGVKTISHRAFADCTGLKRVRLPEGISAITVGMFRNCESLENVILPESVCRIEGGAFSGCKELRSIRIPAGVAVIGNGAFIRCGQLEKVEFSGPMPEVGSCAFLGCRALADAEGFTVLDGTLYGYFGNSETVQVPEGVCRLEDGCFEGRENVKHVYLPDSVHTIEESAFYSCGLETVRLPQSITEIKKDTFRCCRYLKRIAVPEGVKTLCRGAFYGCMALEEVLLPDSLQRIQQGAFTLCNAIRVLRCPDNCRIEWQGVDLEYMYLRNDLQCSDKLRRKIIQRIRQWKSCYAVEKGTAEEVQRLLNCWKRMPLDKLEKYLEDAITAGNRETTAVLLEYKNRNFSREYLEADANRKLETELGLRERTLSQWRKLYRISFRNGCVTLSGYRGEERYVKVPEKVSGCPVTVLKATFYNHNPHEVVLPNSVEEIGENTFFLCTALERVRFPKNLKRIGRNAFHLCLQLETVTLPKGVRSIAREAFHFCPKLKLVRIPASVTEIGADAFLGSADSFRICGKPGSYAETYAKENNIPFTEE